MFRNFYAELRIRQKKGIPHVQSNHHKCGGLLWRRGSLQRHQIAQIELFIVRLLADFKVPSHGPDGYLCPLYDEDRHHAQQAQRLALMDCDH